MSYEVQWQRLESSETEKKIEDVLPQELLSKSACGRLGLKLVSSLSSNDPPGSLYTQLTPHGSVQTPTVHQQSSPSDVHMFCSQIVCGLKWVVSIHTLVQFHSKVGTLKFVLINTIKWPCIHNVYTWPFNGVHALGLDLILPEMWVSFPLSWDRVQCRQYILQNGTYHTCKIC